MHVKLSTMQYVDVFTGIGGIGIALAPFVKPILYCEHDKYCQQVLTSRMRDGLLDKAPIHGDIKTLHLSSHLSPKMIGGGFPCQDISTAGNMAGIVDGTRSSLFYEMLRIVDETPSIQIMFLENVSNIIKCGMEDVVKELDRRAFQYFWTTRAASGHGAPHQRSRWFCLAVRGDHVFELLQSIDLSSGDPPLCTWEKEWTPRISFRPNSGVEDDSWDEHWIHRCHTLGNTVVPVVVRSAFIELVTLCRNADVLSASLASYSTVASTLAYPYPEAGFVLKDRFYPMPKALPIVKPGQIDIAMMVGGKETRMQSYPTPRRGITHHSQPSERSMHDLPTVLVHCNVSKEYQNSLGYQPGEKAVVPNVNYIEWMMGYPKDWTKVSRDLPFVADGRKAAAAMATGEEEHVVKKEKVKANHKQTGNGLHLFMKENRGKDLKESCALWRHLSLETKASYSKRAREMAAAVTVVNE